MANVMLVNFHRKSPVQGLQKITVRQKYGNHTLSFLDYTIDKKRDYLLPAENTPLAVGWGVGPTGIRTYYGYVNHYETITDDLGHVGTRLIALGTSKVMNTAIPSSWLGTTRSSITREIAIRHRLRSVIHDHPFVVEQWATGQRTDFKALKDLAEEIGYRFWVDGSTLYFIDPVKTLRSASAISAPLIRRNDIKSIQVMGGSNIPGLITPSTRRVQFGLDYRTNEFFTATSGDPSMPTEVSSQTATTFGEAEDAANAADRVQNDQFVLTATILGNARISPGTTIRVDPGTVNNDQEGLWLVSEASHEITKTYFYTKIVATRGNDTSPLSRNSTPVLGGADPLAVVRNGLTWEAALQEHVRV